MEVYVRTLCLTCLGIEVLCADCENTGKINKWIQLAEIAEEVKQWQQSVEWNVAPQFQFPLEIKSSDDDITLPPNINI